MSLCFPAFLTLVHVRPFSFRNISPVISGRSTQRARPSFKVSRASARSVRGDERNEENEFDDEEPTIFAPESRAQALWASVAERVSLDRPFSAEEQERLMQKLPAPIAKFLIRRAEEAVMPTDDGSDNRDEIFSRRRERLIARAKAWLGHFPMDEPDESAFDEYMYETVDMDKTPVWSHQDGSSDNSTRERDDRNGGDPDADKSVGRRASSNSESGNQADSSGGVASVATRMVSIFRGSPTSAKEQSQLLAAAIVGLAVLAICLKIALAFAQFFLSFTFSFLAIFALSAGIFVFFYIIRF